MHQQGSHERGLLRQQERVLPEDGVLRVRSHRRLHGHQIEQELPEGVLQKGCRLYVFREVQGGA